MTLWPGESPFSAQVGPGVMTSNPYLWRMNERFKLWLKRVGWLGFLFFLVKGLLWLLIPYLIAKGFLSK